MKKRVLIAGAGCSGLTAIKSCLDEDLEPVCLERTDHIAGLWYFTEEAIENEACVARSTVINTSKEMMCYSDFPIPDDFSNYMHNTKVAEYFNLYAERFQLKKHIRFRTEIQHAKPAADFKESGQWNVSVKDLESGKVTDEVFDAILVCTGHHCDKNVPDFPGMADFQGRILHTHDYKDSRGFEGKRAVVVGIGNSGADAAMELSHVCKQAFVSTRRGSWILSRIGFNGLPVDLIITKRIMAYLISKLPGSVTNGMMEAMMNNRFDHELYGLKPEHRYTGQHPTLGDDMANRIAAGSLIVKPNVKRITKTGVEFDDGSVEDNIDLIVLATGYKFGFPYIDKSVIDVKNNEVNLFKYVFPPDLNPPTLGVIGCIQPVGAIMPIAELQCRWATRVFTGRQALPSRDEMWMDVNKKKDDLRMRYVQTQRHTIQVDWVPFMDEVAEQFGAKPDMGALFRSDPLLWKEVLFGPCTPYQYRLMGPGKWSGARNAIMTQWDRIRKPTQTRRVATKNQVNLRKAIVVALLAMLFLWFFIL